ncbi:hypothetical protein ACFVIM_14015 [Streptomyces sp. NPDC057638]|uniref:hypothetical protein n=1 Tax=Streptomyces sp. NPDC057638 TaxID=3346190 RepID=UPI0036C0141D
MKAPRTARTALVIGVAVVMAAGSAPAFATAQAPSPSQAPATTDAAADPRAPWTTSTIARANSIALSTTRVSADITWTSGMVLKPRGDGDFFFDPTIWERDERKGNGWRKLPTAPVKDPRGIARFNDVDATSPRDAIAVSDYTKPSKGIITQRWNGTSWRNVIAPAPKDAITAGFVAVDARTPRDAWAAGWAQVPSGPQKSKPIGQLQHWDGTRWTPAELPDAGEGKDGGWVLNDVTALARDNVWAVGYAFNAKESRALLLHYDGRRWRKVDAPVPASVRVRIDSAAAAPDGTVWVAGSGVRPNGAKRGVVLRLSKGKWTQVKVPADVWELRNIAVSGSSPVILTDTTETAGPVALRLSGSSWTSLKLPDRGPRSTPSDITTHGRTIDVTLSTLREGTDFTGPTEVLTTRR